MDVYLITGLLVLAAMSFSVAGFASRWRGLQRLQFAQDRSFPKGRAAEGVLYALTLGMAPWSKESTRRHWVAYLRGIAFHIGIFAGLGTLVVSPWFEAIPPILRYLLALVTAMGAVTGAAGGFMRLHEHNLRGISTLDDHISVWLVTLFLTTATVALVASASLPVMWIVSAALLLYAPLGKIRHCIYFFYGRFFYGLHIGRRGIVPGLAQHSHLIPASALNSPRQPSGGRGGVHGR